MTRLTVVFKKGNAKLPSNCRPIAITPILYKIFSRKFCERIQTTLMSQQSPGQAAAVSCWLQHRRPFVAVTLITGLCSEWRSELWLGLIDFEKAFDTVEHDVLWEVLKDQGLHPDYIDIIKRLYDGQTAYVQAGAAEFLAALSKAKAESAPENVRDEVRRAWLRRWRNLLSCTAASWKEGRFLE